MCIRAPLTKDIAQMTKTGIIHFFLLAHVTFDGDLNFQKHLAIGMSLGQIIQYLPVGYYDEVPRLAV